jgi:hypothetical protein
MSRIHLHIGNDLQSPIARLGLQVRPRLASQEAVRARGLGMAGFRLAAQRKNCPRECRIVTRLGLSPDKRAYQTSGFQTKCRCPVSRHKIRITEARVRVKSVHGAETKTTTHYRPCGSFPIVGLRVLLRILDTSTFAASHLRSRSRMFLRSAACLVASRMAGGAFLHREWSQLPINALTGQVGTGSNLSDRIRRLGLGAFVLGLRLSS